VARRDARAGGLISSTTTGDGLDDVALEIAMELCGKGLLEVRALGYQLAQYESRWSPARDSGGPHCAPAIAAHNPERCAVT